MNKIIESSLEDIKAPQTDTDWQQHDLDNDDMDMASAILDAHDDPC